MFVVTLCSLTSILKKALPSLRERERQTTFDWMLEMDAIDMRRNSDSPPDALGSEGRDCTLVIEFNLKIWIDHLLKTLDSQEVDSS